MKKLNAERLAKAQKAKEESESSSHAATEALESVVKAAVANSKKEEEAPKEDAETPKKK